MSKQLYKETSLCLLLEEAIRNEERTADTYEKLLEAAKEIWKEFDVAALGEVLESEKREDFVKTIDTFGFSAMGNVAILKMYRDEFCWIGSALDKMKRELDRKVEFKKLKEKLEKERLQILR